MSEKIINKIPLIVSVQSGIYQVYGIRRLMDFPASLVYLPQLTGIEQAKLIFLKIHPMLIDHDCNLIKVLLLGSSKNFCYLCEALYNMALESNCHNSFERIIRFYFLTNEDYAWDQSISLDENGILYYDISEVEQEWKLWIPRTKEVNPASPSYDKLGNPLPMAIKYDKHIDHRTITKLVLDLRPKIIAINYPEELNSARVVSSVYWALRALLDVKSKWKDRVKKEIELPFITAVYSGIDHEILNNLMIGENALLSYLTREQTTEKSSWKAYPSSYPDGAQDKYLDTIRLIMGAVRSIEATPKSKKKPESLPLCKQTKEIKPIPIEINLCMHDLPGGLCNIMLGLGGYILKSPKIKAEIECIPSFHYSVVQCINEQRFIGSALTEFFLNVNASTKKTLVQNMLDHNYNELSPVVASIYHSLDLREKNKDLDLEKAVWSIFNSFNKQSNQNEPQKSDYREQEMRVCCPGRLECPIYAYMPVLEVTHFYDHFYKDPANDEPELDDEYYKHLYVKRNLECKHNCPHARADKKLKPPKSQNAANKNEIWGHMAFCAEGASAPATYGAVLTSLLGVENFNNVVGPSGSEYSINLSYLRNFECTNEFCTFIKAYGVLETKRELTPNDEPNKKLDAALISLQGENSVDVEKCIIPYLREIGFNKVFWSFDEVNGTTIVYFVLALQEREPGQKDPEIPDPIKAMQEICYKCSASERFCVIKRRIMETRKGEKIGEMRRMVRFTEYP